MIGADLAVRDNSSVNSKRVVVTTVIKLKFHPDAFGEGACAVGNGPFRTEGRPRPTSRRSSLLCGEMTRIGRDRSIDAA